MKTQSHVRDGSASERNTLPNGQFVCKRGSPNRSASETTKLAFSPLCPLTKLLSCCAAAHQRTVQSVSRLANQFQEWCSYSSALSTLPFMTSVKSAIGESLSVNIDHNAWGEVKVVVVQLINSTVSSLVAPF
jgi:hypothetical protein